MLVLKQNHTQSVIPEDQNNVSFETKPHTRLDPRGPE